MQKQKALAQQHRGPRRLAPSTGRAKQGKAVGSNWLLRKMQQQGRQQASGAHAQAPPDINITAMHKTLGEPATRDWSESAPSSAGILISRMVEATTLMHLRDTASSRSLLSTQWRTSYKL